jgi:hypothetical protein
MKPVQKSLKIDVLYPPFANAGDEKRIMLLYEGNNVPYPFLIKIFALRIFSKIISNISFAKFAIFLPGFISILAGSCVDVPNSY